MLHFTNITTFHKLKKEEERCKLLQALNASIHHEMLTPLGTNVMIADRLLNTVESNQQKRMVQLILTCSNLALFHANDLLDHKIIQNGSFSSIYTSESITKTIQQSIQLVNYQLQAGNIQIEHQQSKQSQSNYKFMLDKRRLQQVLLNLLTNACKFQKMGQIIVKHRLEKLDEQDNEFQLEI